MSRVFRTLVAARAKLYDREILPVRRLAHPVISVGNLTTGGTGKTPLVIALASRFRDAGFRPVILSRGYRRKGRGNVVVSRGDGPLIDWTQSGDEPQMMAIRLPGVSVVVGPDRYRAGRMAEDHDLGDLFILDDGFQHRRLHRDVDVVTIDPFEWAEPERLLPEGRWREPRSAIGRAHAACVRAIPEAPEVALDLPVFEVDTVVEGLVHRGRLLPVSDLAGQPVTAFAGIARPERFFAMLHDIGLDVKRTRAFRDHHAFTADEMARLGPGPLITTEKDAIRLEPGDFYFLRISANIRRFNELQDLIDHRMNT